MVLKSKKDTSLTSGRIGKNVVGSKRGFSGICGVYSIERLSSNDQSVNFEDLMTLTFINDLGWRFLDVLS